MKSEELYLRSILEAIQQIEQYVSVGRDIFIDTPHWQDSVARRLINIGEAVKHLSAASRTRQPHISWKRIAGLRDILVHNYMDIDIDAVWNITQRDLPPLKLAVEDILAWIG